MLRKRDGQLEELRAEVKAYREVEDSLQKEIKRLDAEVERLKKLEAICHCGEKVSAHNMGSGHSPVEMEEQCPYKSRAEQAEAALRELYTYPGVRDLLAPKDSLGSIARKVEDVLK